MRPLLVLILVAAALGGFWLAFNTGDDDTSGDAGLNPTGTPTEGIAPDRNPDPTNLVETTGGSRTVAELDKPLEAVKPRPVNAGQGMLGTSVYGTVVDQDGKPMNEVEVTLTRSGLFGIPFLEDGDTTGDDPRVKTNAEGKFQFKDVEPYESYTVIAHHSRYGRAEESDVNVIEGDPVQVEIQMGGGIRLYGIITDGSGGGVANATVAVGLTALGAIAPEDRNAVRQTTDASGRYDFESLAAGNYVLTVAADGYGTVSLQQLNLTGTQEMERNVVLQVAQMIGGRITSTNGDPIPDAIVQAYALARGQNTTRTQTKTDTKGDFIIQDIPTGSYTLMIRKNGFGVEREPRVEAGDMSIMVQLTPNPSVSGQVIDARTGQPLRSFTVQLRQEVSGSGVSSPIKNTAMDVRDDDGRFMLTCPGKGEYMVEARSAGHPANFSQKFSVTDSQNLEGIVVRMNPGGKISGRVIDMQGRPIAGATVTSRDTGWSDDAFMRSLGDAYPTHSSTVKARTNAEGLFSLTPLTPAGYMLEVKHKDHATKYQRDMIVSEGLETKVGDIMLSRGATIEGTVNGPSGTPLPGARVQLIMDQLSPDSFATTYVAKTNKQGKYKISHVKAGSYQVHASRPMRAGGDDPFRAIVDTKNTSRKVSVVEGDSYTGIDFTLGN